MVLIQVQNNTPTHARRKAYNPATRIIILKTISRKDKAVTFSYALLATAVRCVAKNGVHIFKQRLDLHSIVV